jgi:hypothetical protein
MSHSPSTTAATTPRWVGPCVLSSIFHLSAVVLIVAAIDSQAPQGAGDFSGSEIGIVLSDDEPKSGSGPAGEASHVVAAPQPVPPPVAPIAPTTSPNSAVSQQPHPSTPRVAQAQVPAGGGDGYGTGDGQASVRVFGVEGKGTRFVYVFDRSSSMEGAPLATAKQQLIQSLESLTSVHQFHIIFFNQQMRHFDLSGGGRRVAFATDRNKNLAARFVGGITADGGTDRLPALRAAVQMNPDVIFFLTDADDPMPRAELAEIAELNERAGVVISTIEFGRGPTKQAKNFLTELARTTGGQYGYVDTTKLGQQKK